MVIKINILKNNMLKRNIISPHQTGPVLFAFLRQLVILLDWESFYYLRSGFALHYEITRGVLVDVPVDSVWVVDW